jgi:glycosyltransferase involved in cell wall biosynthesis
MVRRSVPRVSVLLPVRNAAPWLASSLASLARQTETDHEVIAVDDGSTDGSGELLDRAAVRDARITVRHTPALGLPAALNLALSLARAPWVARQDADDLSHRARFQRQLAWLERNPGVDVLGTRVRLFPAQATGTGMRRWARWHDALLEHDEMRRELLIDSPLAHGTAMLRRATLETAGGWFERGWAEDLDLWLRLFEVGARFAKLADPLYGWRQHPGSSTRTDERYSRANFLSLKLASLDAGILRNGRRATLVGSGTSLVRWRDALGTRIETYHEVGKRIPIPAPAWRFPLVLSLLAPVARARWREFLTKCGRRELHDFIFVS